MLAHDVLTGPGADPRRSVLFLHGLLGDRTNLRTLARGLVTKRPEVAAVMVDLRMHGESQGLPPPHTIEACAQDLSELCGSLDHPVRAAVGHSLGGKVALAFAAAKPTDLEQVWTIDSMPGARTIRDSIVNVLDFLEGLPAVLASRDDLVRRAVDYGLDQGLGQWLAKNLRPSDGGFGLRIDLGVIRTLLASHYATDLWHVLEHPGSLELHVVIGGRSTAFSSDERSRVATIAAAQARVQLHVIEGAGHWVHVDARAELLELLLASF